MSKSSYTARPRDRMNWDDVRVFLAVAECGSVNKAAQTLCVTPGMVSRRLDDLEAALDVRLFSRTASGMVLTPAGEDMFDRALSMQRFAHAIESTVRERDRKDEGMVTLRAPDGLTGYWIAPSLPDFLSAHPKIQITLDCGTISQVIGAEPDISLTADKTEANDGDLIDPIATLHYVLLAAPSYLETYGTPASAASAAGDHRALRHVSQTFQREKWDARATAIEALASFSVVSNSSTVILSATLAGAGVCTAPSLFCHLYPELHVVGPETGFPIQLWMITHKAARDSVRVQRLARWLRTLFDTKLNPWFRDEFVPPSHFAAELDAIGMRLAPKITPPQRKATSKLAAARRTRRSGERA